MNKIMRRAASSILFLLAFGAAVFAQDYDRSEYSPLTQGMKLKYANYDEDGKATGYYIIHVKSVSGDMKDGEIAFDQHFLDKDGKPRFDRDNNVPMTVSVKDGKTISRMSGLGRVMKVQDDISKGDSSSIPSELKSGQTLPDGEITVKVDKISSYIYTLERKVIKEERVTVKAGTFDTFLLKEIQHTKTIGTKKEGIETWYAKGIGAVKQNVYDKKGNLQSRQELISLSF